VIFRHCWECMLEVTPSRRCVVDRHMSMVDNPGERRILLIPVTPERLEALCDSSTYPVRQPRGNAASIQWDTA
jgi:hypothetical protein